MGESAEDRPSSWLAQALQRSEDRYAALLTSRGDLISAAEVAERLRISEAEVEILRQERRLLGIRREQAFMYPAWQLGSAGPLPAVVKILAVLAIGVGDPRAQLAFLVTERPDLDGLTPLDALRSGRIDEVLEIARNYRV